MPPNPQFPDGKAFSSQYFHKTPSKIGKCLKVAEYMYLVMLLCFAIDLQKSTVCIYQNRVNPPCYKVGIMPVVSLKHY